MRGEFGSVQMLETGEDLQVLSLEIFPCTIGISHAWVPQILVKQRDVLLNRRREISIIGNIAAHPLSIVVINLIEDNVYSFLKVTLRLAIKLVQSPVELHHRVIFLIVSHEGALASIRH